jgi:hypothetical protein
MGYCDVCQSAGSVNKYGFCQICGTEHRISVEKLVPALVMQLEKQNIEIPAAIRGV